MQHGMCVFFARVNKTFQTHIKASLRTLIDLASCTLLASTCQPCAHGREISTRTLWFLVPPSSIIPHCVLSCSSAYLTHTTMSSTATGPTPVEGRPVSVACVLSNQSSARQLLDRNPLRPPSSPPPLSLLTRPHRPSPSIPTLPHICRAIPLGSYQAHALKSKANTSCIVQLAREPMEWLFLQTTPRRGRRWPSKRCPMLSMI
jgi:hypothetical protein